MDVYIASSRKAKQKNERIHMYTLESGSMMSFLKLKKIQNNFLSQREGFRQVKKKEKQTNESKWRR